MSLDEATELRSTWIRTFREMAYHMQPEEMPAGSAARRAYGQDDGDDDEAEEDNTGHERQLYRARLVNGMLRSNSSYCSALNFQFQGLVACGAKLAGWNLVYYAGMGDRIVNFVHRWCTVKKVNCWKAKRTAKDAC